MADQPVPRPQDPLEEHERQTAVEQIQRATVDGHLDFEEIDERFGLVYNAETRADLAAVVADLPVPPTPGPIPAGHPVPRSSFAVLGDLSVGGWVEVDGDLSYTTLLGDIVIDLSSARLPPEVTITTYSLLGDTVVIVPDGVRATAQSVLLLGDRRTDLTPPRHDAPIVRVRARKALGDVKLFSLSRVPEGRFRQLWRKLRSE
ncbi:MAG: DUF1707 SHOCT-like domain-containing protein [Acidimicrobiales bacterium]